MATKSKPAKKAIPVKAGAKGKPARTVSKNKSAAVVKKVTNPAAKKTAKEVLVKANQAAKKVVKPMPVKPASKNTDNKPGILKKKATVKRPGVKEVIKNKKSIQKVSEKPAAKLPHVLVDKVVNSNNLTQSLTGETKLNPAENDPLQAFSKQEYAKATSKGDPHVKIQLSSKPKSTIKPSGKKPLWR